jgi:hypothetical protein
MRINPESKKAAWADRLIHVAIAVLIALAIAG